MSNEFMFYFLTGIVFAFWYWVNVNTYYRYFFVFLLWLFAWPLMLLVNVFTDEFR